MSQSEDAMSKKRKIDGSLKVQPENSNITIDLPPELWAAALEYLPFQDVNKLSVVSTMFMSQVFPHVTRIQSFRPIDLSVKFAQRFPNAEEVYICSLLKKPAPRPSGIPSFVNEEWNLEYCMETQNRVIPFLSQFRKLRYVFCGAITLWNNEGHRRDVWNGRSPRRDQHSYAAVTDDDKQNHMHRALVHQFSGAIASGAIPRTCEKVDGLFHIKGVKLCPSPVSRLPSTNNDDNNNNDPNRPSTAPLEPCEICTHIIHHFPSTWILQARGQCLCIPAKKRLQEIVRRGDERIIKRPERVEEIFREGLSSKGNLVKFEPFCMEELQKMHELKLLDAKATNPDIFYKLLDNIRTERTVFSKQTLDDLNALGFQFTSEALKEHGVPLINQPTQAGDDPSSLRSFFEHFLHPLRRMGDVNIEIVEGPNENPALEILQNLAMGNIRSSMEGIRPMRMERPVIRHHRLFESRPLPIRRTRQGPERRPYRGPPGMPRPPADEVAAWASAASSQRTEPQQPVPPAAASATASTMQQNAISNDQSTARKRKRD